VTFKPDLSRFGMETLKDDDILSVMNMRVYDVAGCNETLNVRSPTHTLRVPTRDVPRRAADNIHTHTPFRFVRRCISTSVLCLIRSRTTLACTTARR
jgi:hypothetical protein